MNFILTKLVTFVDSRNYASITKFGTFADYIDLTASTSSVFLSVLSVSLSSLAAIKGTGSTSTCLNLSFGSLVFLPCIRRDFFRGIPSAGEQFVCKFVGMSLASRLTPCSCVTQSREEFIQIFCAARPFETIPAFF